MVMSAARALTPCTDGNNIDVMATLCPMRYRY
jgi:hypothetical protein